MHIHFSTIQGGRRATRIISCEIKVLAWLTLLLSIVSASKMVVASFHWRIMADCNDMMTAQLQDGTSNLGSPTEVSSTNESSGGFSAVGIMVLSCLLVLLSLILVVLMLLVTRGRRRNVFTPRREVSEKRITRRYETIEGWLVSKKVQAHDTVCQQCAKEFGQERVEENEEDAMTIKRVDTNDTDDECLSESRECPICMEDLKVGDLVSWSTNRTCDHVFHHECIKEWLLRHINCPFCRQVFMPVDEIRGEEKAERLQEMLTQHKIRNSTTYYCVKEGLVTIPSVVRCTKRELKLLQHRICDCVVRRKELALLRGSRHETSATNIVGDPTVLSLAPEQAPRMETASSIDIDPLDDSLEDYESSVIDEEMGQAMDALSVEAEIVEHISSQVGVEESAVDSNSEERPSDEDESEASETEERRLRSDPMGDAEEGRAKQDLSEEQTLEIW